MRIRQPLFSGFEDFIQNGMERLRVEIRYITKSDDRLASIPKGQWASRIEQADRKNLVMVQDEMIIGTSGFGKSRMEEMNGFGEIISLYFLPEYMGKGYGRLLLREVVGELKRMDFDKVFLWVLEENRNARRFYEKCGFVQTERRLTNNIGGKELKEVQYCYYTRR